MDNRNGHQTAQNGPPSLPDISKSTLSATAPIFIPRSYQPPPPPENEVRRDMPPQYQGYIPQQQPHQQQQPEYEPDFSQGGHRGGYGGGGGGYYNNRGNYRGHRGRGRGHRGGGRGGGYRGNYHNSYHGGQQQHHGGGGGGGGHHCGPHGRHQGGQYANAPHDAVEQVKQAIAVMTETPEMFDEIMQPLTASLATIVRSETELRSIVEELITQSVRETNFRYIGAKMCNFFSQHLQVSIPNGIFRTHLLGRLQEEQNQRDQVLESPRSSEHLIGFTLFMGELLVNPTTDPEFERLVDIWTVAIEELVETLLAAGHDNCLRAVVQVLKLTGSQLDKSDRGRHPSGQPERVDTIFDKIKAVIEEERMQSPTARSMKVYLQSVVDLRSTEWGQKEKDGRPKQVNPYLNMQVPTPLSEVQIMPMWSNGSDFSGGGGGGGGGGVEGSDGQPEVYWSPAEEEEYYAYMMSEEAEQGGGGAPPFQEEMDEEIADAFEEFMRENDARQGNVQQ